jgi:hypothetical protein
LLKKLSLVVGAVVLLAACGASTSEESETVGAVEGAITGVVCSGAEGCGDNAYPASTYCTTSCYPYACGSSPNATVCVAPGETTTEYWMCGNSDACDAGWHVTGYKCDNTGPCMRACSGSNPFPANMTQCTRNTDDYWQCSASTPNPTCPTGYSDKGLGCVPSLTGCGSCNNYWGANARRCVKNTP